MKQNTDELILKSGDILLFSVLKKDIISSLIGLLTNSDVSHAALYADEKAETILEATGENPVLENHAPERFAGRTIHVYRRRDGEEMSPVVEKGREYVQNRVQYGGIYCLGLLLISSKYCMARWNKETASAAIVLLASTYKIIRNLLEGENPTVFCSQFVAQCCEEAGDQYRLHFESSVIPLKEEAGKKERTLLSEAIEAWDAGVFSLEDCSNEPKMLSNASLPDLLNNCQILIEASDTTREKTVRAMTVKKHGELMIWTARVAYAWYCLITHKKHWKDIWSADLQKKALEWLDQNRAAFIAPEDFKHTKELELIGLLS